MRVSVGYEVWILPEGTEILRPLGRNLSESEVWVRTLKGPPAATIEPKIRASPQDAVRRAADGRWKGGELCFVTKSIPWGSMRVWKMFRCPLTGEARVKEVRR